MNSLDIQTPRFPLPAPTPIHKQAPLSSIKPAPTSPRNRSSASAMNNALDSWIAMAEETKRVDRLSSVLGLDSPAMSYGLSPASRELNAPRLNAFRFLPFLQETFPDLLRHNSKHLEQFDSIAKPARRRNDRHNIATQTKAPRGLYQPNLENAEVVTDRGVPSRATKPTACEAARLPTISVATSNLHISENASGTSAGVSSTTTAFSTIPQKFPAWPEPKPTSAADLSDSEMDSPRDSPSMSHLPHLQATNPDHEPSTCVGSSLTSPISDLGFHHLGMGDELDEKNIAASMSSYHEKNDDRIWRWLSSRSISPVYLDTAADEDPDAFSGEPWPRRGRNV